MSAWIRRRGLEIGAIAFFLAFSAVALILPLVNPAFASARHAAAFNAALSIGTGGLTSFLFYYLVSERLEARRRNMSRDVLASTYREAKRHIAAAIVQASRLGGRSDLVGNLETIEKMLTPEGFKSLFEGGREATEGYYAFQNQMSQRTYEYDEIEFNLKVIARAAERLIDSGVVDDQSTYEFFVRLSTLVARIEKAGPGYDESKPLCAFLWEIFAGWNFVDGNLGYDPVERAIQRLAVPKSRRRS